MSNVENLKPSGDSGVAFIQLRGAPYRRELQTGEVIDCNVTADSLMKVTNYRQQIYDRVGQVEAHLQSLFTESGFYTLDGKIKHGENLTFDESFSLATFVCAALNRPLNDAISKRIQALGSHDTHLLQATALLSSMSAKEAYVGLTAEEIAGLVAATVHLDTLVRIPNARPTIAFGGMGGDKGYPLNGENTKLFSLSTLASIALATDGPVHKHHSYPNTSKVAGQSAIEAFGARSDFHTQRSFENVLAESDLLMTSCHDTRTLHTLSHLLKGETINHVIGPLSFTLSADTPIQAMIGVNEKIHPERIIEAMIILDKKGFQKYRSGAVFCGTNLTSIRPDQLNDTPENAPLLTEHIRLDEVAPPPYTSVVAFCQDGQSMGTYMINPEDFYTPEELDQMSLSELEIHNTTEDIIKANKQALAGQNYTRTRYLAMTIGLGLFTRYALTQKDALDSNSRTVNRTYLRACVKRGVVILKSGAAVEKLQQYIEVTNNHAGNHHGNTK